MIKGKGELGERGRFERKSEGGREMQHHVLLGLW